MVVDSHYYYYYIYYFFKNILYMMMMIVVDDDGKRYCAVQRPALYLQSSGGDLLGPIKKNIYLLRKVSVRPAIEKSLD